MSNVRKNPNKFQEHCIQHGLTAVKVAELIEVSPRTVYSYFQGERLPSRKTMKLMDEKLGINSKEMF